MANNGLLISLALLERTEPYLKVDKREQLDRLNLDMIRVNVSKALEYIADAKLDDIYITGPLLSAVECIEVLLENNSFIETDLETKDIITEKITTALDKMYVAVGKYYTHRNFDYNVRLYPMLKRVVDECIRNEYYFEKTFREEK